MGNKDMQELFNLAQNGQANHKKYLNKLQNIYQAQDLKNFMSEFMRLLLHAFNTEVTNNFTKSVLEFASSFCVQIITDHERHMKENSQSDEYEHPLLFNIVNAVLKYVSSSNFNIRVHACQFLAILLGNFDSDIAISDVVCDKIQKALLERTVDAKPQVRSQAIKVLSRLQNPYDPNCPVIISFINSLCDPAGSVRKLVVENIAPCQTTFGHIVTRLRDTDTSVRVATFIKLSKLLPKILTIVYRQSIVGSGLLETDATTKRAFQQILLPKWLKAYDSNIIQFMNALKLDAHEVDIIETEMIYEKLLPIMFKMLSLQELVALLELDDAKLIPIASLSIEKINYWNCFITYLMNLGVEEIEFDDIIPALTNFTTYIDSFIKFKSKTQLEHWEYLEYQQILRKLFELLLKLDVSDEFGRQEMQKLLVSVLKTVELQQHVIGIIIRNFHKIVPNVNELAHDLCLIIADIREPLESEIPTDMNRSQIYQITQLKVQLHRINDEMKKAVDERDYDLVDKLSKDATDLEKQVKEMNENFNAQAVLVRKPSNDMKTICRCMDIILAFMENIRIETLPPPLLTFKNEFLKNEKIDPNYNGIYQKMFKMTCLYAILDKDFALEGLETICTPIIAYQVSPALEKNVLKIAVGAVSDLIRIYGPDIFNNVTTEQGKKNKDGAKKRVNDRTLYSEAIYDTDIETSSTVGMASATPGILIDIILNMLDDNDPAIREYATVALMKLVVKGLCVNASLITRLLLKWFNPTLNTDDKSDMKIQRYIGTALTKYVYGIRNSPAILEKAIIPTLCSIGNAPKTSPLVDVDYDDALHCLIKFTRMREDTTMNIHKYLAYSILSKVRKSNEPSVRILTKMLTFLDIPTDEPNIIRELTQATDLALDSVTDKSAVTYLKKYLNKLNGICEANESGSTLDRTGRTTLTPARGRKKSSNTRIQNAIDSSALPTIEEANDTINESNRSTPAKRRNCKQSGEANKNSSVKEPNYSTCSKNNDHLVLQTIQENCEETSIQTPSNDSSLHSSDSASANGESQDHNNKLIAPVKRKKGRGNRKKVSVEKDKNLEPTGDSADEANQSNTEIRPDGNKTKLSSISKDTLYTQSSSDTEDTSDVQSKKKTRRRS